MANLSDARVRRQSTTELDPRLQRAMRRLVEAAFAGTEDGDFTEHDWQHVMAGRHFLLEVEGKLVAYASVAERRLEIAGQPVRTGYVEVLAVEPAYQRRGLGTALMRAVNADIAERFELGALGTGSHRFYERLGWQTWQGPSSARAPDGIWRTAEDDGFILVLPTPTSPPIRLTDPISCEWRLGDVW